MHAALILASIGGWLLPAAHAAPDPEAPPPDAAVLIEAVPLSEDMLGRPESLRARIAVLQDEAVRRRVDRQTAGASASEADRVRWAADEARATAEQDQLLTVLANLEARPELRATAQSDRQAAVQRLRDLLGEMPPPEGPDATRALARLDADDDAYNELLTEIRRADNRLPVARADADREALGDPAQAPGALERLGLLLPALHPEDAGVIDAEVAEWAEQPALPDATEPLSEPRAEARRALAAVRSAAVGEAFAGTREALAIVEAHLAAWPRVTPDRDAQAERAEVEATESQEAAERASDMDVRSVLEQVARAQTRLSEELRQPLFDAEEAPPVTTAAEVAANRRAVAQMNEFGCWALGLCDDVPSADELYEDLLVRAGRLQERELARQHAAVAVERELRDARKTVAEETEAARAAEEAAQALAADRQREVSEAIDEWRVADAAWLKHIEERRDAAKPQGWVERLREIGKLKRDLIPDTSSRVFRRHLPADVANEIAFVRPATEYYSRNRQSMLETQVSSLLTDGNALFQLINGSLFAAGLALAWLFGRSRASSIALSIAKRVRQGRPDLRLSHIQALREPLARTVRNAMDLALGPLLLLNLDALPELELLLRLYLYLALYRFVMALFDLVVVPADEARPALLVLRRESFDMLRRTLRAFALTFALTLLVDYVLGDLMGLGTVLWVTDTGFRVWLALLSVWTLYAWEPLLRTRLRHRFTEPKGLLGWLLPERGSWLLTLPRAAGQLVIVAASTFAELMHQFAEEGTSFSFVYNLFNRAVLHDDAAPDRPLDPDQRDAITQAKTDAKHLVERPELRDINAALVEWQQTHQRGLVAIVGDRGSGKHTAVAEVAERVKASGLDVVRAAMIEPLRNRAELSVWLAIALGCDTENARNNDDLVAALRALPPSAVFIEGIHHTFLRRVDGLEVLRTLLYVLNATSDQHFFVCTVHSPAWDYFDAPGSLIDCGVFQTVVRLQPMDSQQLRNITLARAGHVGLRVDFSSLRIGSLGFDRELEADRATSMYYRLLSEASRGNPQAAVTLFARSLVRTDAPTVVQVTLREVLDLDTLPEVGDTALFVLVALNLHDGLVLDDLVEVTHLPRSIVRASVRDLVSRGWIVRHSDRLRLCDDRRIMVQRSLRRRHFLHLGTDG